jgi:hypothetical protein
VGGRMSNEDLDKLIKELESLTAEIEEYNSNDDYDLTGYGDILECRKICLISKAERYLKGSPFEKYIKKSHLELIK